VSVGRTRGSTLGLGTDGVGLLLLSGGGGGFDDVASVVRSGVLARFLPLPDVLGD